MSRAYFLPKHCPRWSGGLPVAYIGLQPWWRDLGGEHPRADVEEVLFAMGYQRRRIEHVLRQLARRVEHPQDTLRSALDAPASPLVLEGWEPGHSGRHWAVYLYGAGGEIVASRQVPRLRVPPGDRRMRLAP